MDVLDTLSSTMRDYIEAQNTEPLCQLIANSQSLITQNMTRLPIVQAWAVISRSSIDIAKVAMSMLTNNPHVPVSGAKVMSYSLTRDANRLVVQNFRKVRLSFLFVLMFLVSCSNQTVLSHNNNTDMIRLEGHQSVFQIVKHQQPTIALNTVQGKLDNMNIHSLLSPLFLNEKCLDFDQSQKSEMVDYQVFGRSSYYYNFGLGGTCKYTYGPELLSAYESLNVKVLAALNGDRHQANIIPSLNSESQSNCYFYGNAVAVKDDLIIQSFQITSDSQLFGCQQHCLDRPECKSWTFNFLSRNCQLFKTETVSLDSGHGITSAAECRLQSGLGSQKPPENCTYIDISHNKLKFTCPGFHGKIKHMISQIETKIIPSFSICEQFSNEERSFFNKIKTDMVENRLSILTEDDRSLFYKMARRNIIGRSLIEFEQNINTWPNVSQKYAMLNIVQTIGSLYQVYQNCGSQKICEFTDNMLDVYSMMPSPSLQQNKVVMIGDSWQIKLCNSTDTLCLVSDLSPTRPMRGLQLATTSIDGELVAIIKITGTGDVTLRGQNITNYKIYTKASFILNDCTDFIFNENLIKQRSFLKSCQLQNYVIITPRLAEQIPQEYEGELNYNEIAQYIIMMILFAFMAVSKFCLVRRGQGSAPPTAMIDTTVSQSFEANNDEILYIPVPTNSVNSAK